MTLSNLENLTNLMVHPENIRREPYVNLPNGKIFKSHDKKQEVKINQQLRQKQKFEFFQNSFDFLNDSQIYGDYLEFGVHRARTFRMAMSAARFYNLDDISFHAFDSFEGLPDIGNKLIDQWKPNALTTSEDVFKSLIKSHGLYLNSYYCYKGFYEQSLNERLSAHLLNNFNKAMMITVDCDYYESAVSVFNFIEPFIQHGTIIYLDDVFAGFSKKSKGGVHEAFKTYAKKSKFKFLPHINIGWWGKSFIASQI